MDGSQARVADRINPSGGGAKVHLPDENHAIYVTLARDDHAMALRKRRKATSLP